MYQNSIHFGLKVGTLEPMYMLIIWVHGPLGYQHKEESGQRSFRAGPFRNPLFEGPCTLNGMYFGLKVVTMQVLWGQSVYCLGTWTLSVQ